jgi:uncharacterized membrane protein
MASNVKSQFTDEELDQIKQSIRSAELNTSGEIRVHIEEKCNEAVLDRGAFIFQSLNMHKTEARNGILFYVALKNHKFAVLGDAGIHAKVSEDFWESISNKVISHFKNGDLVLGLSEGIQLAGEQLKAYFPYQQNDKNELSDDVSFG